MKIKKEYERWLANAVADTDVAAELKAMDYVEVEDAFYRDLAFGTGGLRGVIGAGTNRMNIYTVAKASQGLADYLKKHFKEPSVAIGYDSRIKSDVFAKVAAGVFTANGVSVNIWPVLMPVPTVSFATRYLHTSAGVMVTASHNPGKYNGYKVYGADGCQITTEAAAEILAEIEKLDIFADVKTSDFEAGVANGSIRYIPDEVYTAFVEQVKSQSVLFGENVNKNVAIVYSPLNGTGLKPVTRTLQEMGYTNITVVKEQEQPDGHFPTCPYPNPEIKEAMALGMEYARKCNADLLLATDPDCDRVGIAVKNKAGEYELLTGNQTGMLLLDYICSQRIEKKYIDYILNDENWEKTLRSWVVVFWQDVIYDDPYSYMDKGGNWNNIKQRRIGRLQMKNTEDNIKYMRTRAIDLAQLYIFYRNRGWNTLDQKNYNAIINCDTELECYSIQKKELLKKLKEMFKDATLGLFS